MLQNSGGVVVEMKDIMDEAHEASKRYNESEEKRRDRLSFALGQLRHLYKQMLDGNVTDTAAAAKGLLGPSIETLEKDAK